MLSVSFTAEVNGEKMQESVRLHINIFTSRLECMAGTCDIKFSTLLQEHATNQL